MVGTGAAGGGAAAGAGGAAASGAGAAAGLALAGAAEKQKVTNAKSSPKAFTDYLNMLVQPLAEMHCWGLKESLAIN